MLRLEFLFDQYQHYREGASPWSVRAALHCLLDILSVLGHSDLKSDLLKDLGQQRVNLSRLSARDDIDQTRLREVLETLTGAQRQLQYGAAHYPSATLLESDLLRTVVNRFAIPGGTCAFDVPAYHRWLSRPHPQIVADLARWYGHLDVIDRAIRIYLRLLRQTGSSTEQVAETGVFMYTPRTHYQLIRVRIPSTLDVYPEISATRHRFSIRFMELGDVDARNMQTAEAIPFQLQCCTMIQS